MGELLRARSPDLPEALVRQILEHAGGVPLYAVEVVRILADQPAGAATPDRRAEPRPTGARQPSTIEVPDSLHGLIAARIDALPGPERRLLLAAGVLGRRFRPGALIAVAGDDPPVTRERLDGLMRRELLTVDDDLGSPGQGEVGFVQDLVREVAYHTLGRGERRDLHLAAARYLGSLDDENLAESLAGHLVEAHELAPGPSRRVAHRPSRGRRAAAGRPRRRHAARAGTRPRTPGAGAAPRQHVRPSGHGCSRSPRTLPVRPDGWSWRRATCATSSPSTPSPGAPSEVARARAHLASVLLIGQRNEPALTELETAVMAIRDIGCRCRPASSSPRSSRAHAW